MRASLAVAVLALTALVGACTPSAPESALSPMPSAAPSAEPDQPTLQGTAWRLAYVDGRSWPVGDLHDVTLSFREQRLGGFNGCNEFGARWQMAGKELAVGRYSGTLIGCAGDAAWIEDRVLRILSASPVVSLTADDLRIIARPQGALVFERA